MSQVSQARCRQKEEHIQRVPTESLLLCNTGLGMGGREGEREPESKLERLTYISEWQRGKHLREERRQWSASKGELGLEKR